jgi:hypothetical protein
LNIPEFFTRSNHEVNLAILFSSGERSSARLSLAPRSDPRTQQTITSAGDQVTGAENSNWKESFRLIRTWTVQARVVNSSREAAEEPLTPLTGLVALSTFQHRYAWGQFIRLLSF